MEKIIIDIIISAIMLSFICTNPLTESIKIGYKVIIGLVCFITTFSSIVLFDFTFFKSSYVYIQLILSAIIIFLVSKNKIINVICMFLGYISSVVINTVLLFLLNYFLNIATTDLYKTIFSMFAFYIPYFIIMYFSTKGIGILSKRFIKYENNKHIIIAIGAETILCSIIIMFNVTYGQTIGYPPETIFFNCIIFCVSFLLVALILIAIIYSQKKSLLTQQEKQRLHDLETHVSNLETANSTYRSFKHDYINILSTMRSYINENRTAELKEYFENHIMETQLILDENSDTYSELSKIKSLPLKSILISKLNIAVVKNISFLIDVNDDFIVSDKYIVDIATITAIFLDNALEASEQTDKPFIGLILSEYEDCLEIIIENSIKNDSIDLLHIDESGYSTKGDKRGIGLSNADTIIKNIPNLVVDTEIKNHMFIKTLILYKEK